MQSKAPTVEAYLDSLPEERRDALNAVRKVIHQNLDKDVEEGMQYGMIGYYIPHRIFPAGYHCDPSQPLCYAGLASQKNHMSLYVMYCYGNSEAEKWLKNAWKKAGKKLDMGKSCIRFKKLDDLPLDVVGEIFRRSPAKKYIAFYQKILDTRKKPAAKKKPVAAKKKPVKK